MTKHNTQLSRYTVDVYLSQIDKYTSKNTELKLKMRAANLYKKIGGNKYLRKAITLYNDVHNIECSLRGEHQPRSYNILINLVECEKKLNNLKISKNV